MMSFSSEKINTDMLLHLPVWTLVLLALIVNNVSIDVVTSQGSCHLREIDLCSTLALSILQSPKGLPINEDEIDQQCSLLKEAVECTDNFTTRCLDNRVQNVVNMFFGQARDMRREFCTKGSKLRESYKTNAPCLNEARKHFKTVCLTDLQVAFEGIHKSTMFEKIPLGCCNMNRFQACVYDNVREKCGEDTVVFMKSVLDRIISRLPRTMCKDFDPTSSRCTRVLPVSGTNAHVGRNVSAISRLLSTYTNVNTS